MIKNNPLMFHEKALQLRALRTEVLSSNIANADTPNYKARDIDFKSVLRTTTSESAAMRQTKAAHMPANPRSSLGAERLYRVPTQSTLDGNTVETDVEQAEFAENVVRYRASLSFLGGQIKGLRYAIKGGD